MSTLNVEYLTLESPAVKAGLFEMANPPTSRSQHSQETVPSIRPNRMAIRFGETLPDFNEHY